MKADAVFEGGGVRGIAFAGAVSCLEEHGYEWERLAGTSAGAIIAALLAAGYHGLEIYEILTQLDYTKFLDKTALQAIPLAGPLLGLIVQKAIHRGRFIETWVADLLRRQGVKVFGDLMDAAGSSRLKIIASDITRRELLVLPDDLKNYGIDPVRFSVAKAVRMSASIPFYFKPVQLKSPAVSKDPVSLKNLAPLKGTVPLKDQSARSFIVDGGILSNFPVWIFDTQSIPRWPTFGFQLISPGQSKTASGKTNVIDFLLDIISTMLEEDDRRYLHSEDYERTISIPTLGVRTTEFNLSKEKSQALYEAGYQAAGKFLESWDFEQYIKNYRS